jgi:hypothetical protein
VDSTGAIIDFLLSAKRDTVAAKRFWVGGRKGKYSVNGILQSIFRSATRRETLGSHSEGGRRGGELKRSRDYPEQLVGKLLQLGSLSRSPQLYGIKCVNNCREVTTVVRISGI